MTAVQTVNPATDETATTEAAEATTEQVAAACAAAAQAASEFTEGGRALRTALLRAVAVALEDRRAEIIDIGIRETALTEQRLAGELNRTVYQARFFADLVAEGSYLEATIDHAGDSPMGPAPDLRRMLVPIGPVAVFGAGNFPLAFSVPGGDTVSALAAGCPVVIKAHESHPLLSLATHAALQEAVAAVGAPEAVTALVFGRKAGVDLVSDPAITAVTFTGSLGGGRALMDAISARPQPIPFYGELASLNPVVITAAAAAARGGELAQQLIASVTGSGGQLCTKPGLVLIPADAAGDRLVADAVRTLAGTGAQILLNRNIYQSYGETKPGQGMRVIGEGGMPSNVGYSVSPRLLEVAADDLVVAEVEECFGPTTIVVRYQAGEELDVLGALPGSLTGTIHAEPDEREVVSALTQTLAPKVGRLLYAGFPTGVHVGWAQNHGGPWPSTNTQHTSVGATAIRRFLRPVTWQSAPEWLLPDELRDDFDGIPRRVDGVVQAAR
ncbi:aldehyde dehydrogenase (NADP(+)) [Mycobacterium sp. NAZ190054]|uniref:aldehyde dehydrogenase (NADP(+)) n=1 Tax=Mycobacterium sp. NAZ190054 TaxID=1747766 RepID=UPI00079B86E4|nr:aldehyde dehydrogenase (NADP(+)) [Mycobacterium sp. NAZ190054]KWX67934.1 aldehyde dehydrogenase [Mycobacterium sp. NAZ190054]